MKIVLLTIVVLLYGVSNLLCQSDNCEPTEQYFVEFLMNVNNIKGSWKDHRFGVFQHKIFSGKNDSTKHWIYIFGSSSEHVDHTYMLIQQGCNQTVIHTCCFIYQLKFVLQVLIDVHATDEESMKIISTLINCINNYQRNCAYVLSRDEHISDESGKILVIDDVVASLATNNYCIVTTYVNGIKRMTLVSK